MLYWDGIPFGFQTWQWKNISQIYRLSWQIRRTEATMQMRFLLLQTMKTAIQMKENSTPVNYYVICVITCARTQKRHHGFGPICCPRAVHEYMTISNYITAKPLLALSEPRFLKMFVHSRHHQTCCKPGFGPIIGGKISSPETPWGFSPISLY